MTTGTTAGQENAGPGIETMFQSIVSMLEKTVCTRVVCSDVERGLRPTVSNWTCWSSSRNVQI